MTRELALPGVEFSGTLTALALRLFPHLETVSVNHRAASSLSSSKLL